MKVAEVFTSNRVPVGINNFKHFGVEIKVSFEHFPPSNFSKCKTVSARVSLI